MSATEDMYEGWGCYSAEQEAEDRKTLDKYRRTWSAWNWFLAKTDKNPSDYEIQRNRAIHQRAVAADMISTMETLIRSSVEAREERAAIA